MKCYEYGPSLIFPNKNWKNTLAYCAIVLTEHHNFMYYQKLLEAISEKVNWERLFKNKFLGIKNTKNTKMANYILQTSLKTRLNIIYFDIFVAE
jgi:hypothetical protein